MLETITFEHVTQIKMSREVDGKPIYWVAAYLVDGLLIDTGCSYTSRELLSFLKGMNVTLVVNTHFHEDHVGGNRDIIDGFGIEIYAHPDSIPLIAKRPELYPYQEMVWGYPEPSIVKAVPDVVRTDHYAFTVIETPGHSVGHITLAELSKGWFFIGDLFSRENPKFIRPEENIGMIMASMRAILEMAGDRCVLFTSVGKIVEDGGAALKATLEYLSVLAGTAKKMKGEGLAAEEIMIKMFGGEHNFAQLSNGQYTTLNLVRSLMETS